MSSYHKDALPRGSQLAEYTIEAVLGHGGFGVTYLARDTQLGTQVAIKEYLPHDFAHRKGATDIIPNADDDDNDTVVTYRVGLKEFLKEGQALARFKHQNIVRVLRFLEANGTAYMVMEYEQGESLANYLKHDGPRLDQAALLRIFLPILNGLHAVHEAHLLHLDIKPENIYLREDGSSMLIDFGSARQALVGPGPHAVALTPGYAPIEQYPDGGKQGPWTDIYAIGASLHRCIRGKRPVASTERHQAILAYDPDPLRPAVEVGQGQYPGYVLQSIDWALRIHPSERPKSARELQDALMGKGSMRHAQAPAQAVFTGKRPSNSVPPAAAAQTRRAKPRPRRRSPGRWLAVAAVLGALSAGAVFYGPKVQALLPSLLSYVRTLGSEVKPRTKKRHDEARNTAPTSERATDRKATAPAPTTRQQVARAPKRAERRPLASSRPEPTLELPDSLALTLAGHKDWVYAIAFSPDGKTLASAGYDKTIRLWNVTTGASRRVLRGHGRSINSVAYSADGKWLASAADDATVRLWNAATGRTKRKLRGPGYAVYSVAFSPTGSRLAAGGKDRTVFVWN
ncbi:MAG: protein kinase, partial [Acidiferrobacterales bacterium]